MGDGQMMSELYQENMKRQNKNRRRKDAAAFLLYPAGKPDCSCQHEYLCGAGRAGAGRVYRTGQADPENRSQFL